jgi:hypothetical protein
MLMLVFVFLTGTEKNKMVYFATIPYSEFLWKDEALAPSPPLVGSRNRLPT